MTTRPGRTRRREPAEEFLQREQQRLVFGVQLPDDDTQGFVQVGIVEPAQRLGAHARLQVLQPFEEKAHELVARRPLAGERNENRLGTLG